MIKKRIIELARTELVKCSKGDSIATIARTMIDNTVGSIFVMGDAGELEGIITDKSIFALIAKGKNPLELTPSDLTEKLKVVGADDDALDVLSLMESEGLSRVAISNKEGEIIGVVSKKKLKFEKLRILKEELGIQI
ncbi:MAG: CBS domain-containing protein [Promethearchaeota archaeon]